uniref:RING-type domain-containing protein n=1 Tax=Anopheles quadriannulatus TaxID=34691 RepID=A0A182XQ26_ANOQN
LESLSKGSENLTFNLTPEQLGVRHAIERAGRTRRSISSVENLLSADASTRQREECLRKSSLRRNSAYSNQSKMQLALEQHPDALPESPTGTLAGLLRMMMMMMIPAAFYGRRMSMDLGACTIYDHFPANFLPNRFLCELCQKLLREPRVLDCLHTFCRACLERVAATVTHGSGSTSMKMPPSIG